MTRSTRHDFTLDAVGDGRDAVMNYAGFTRPVWTWLRGSGFAPKFLGSPLMVPRLGGTSVMETMREFSATAPWRSSRTPVMGTRGSWRSIGASSLRVTSVMPCGTVV